MLIIFRGGGIIQNNIKESYYIMTEEGLYPNVGYETDDFRIRQQIDGYTDAIYLNVAFEAGEHNVLEAIASDYCGGSGNDPLEQLGYRIEHPGENLTNYGRQWFGAMIYIRPLLAVFNLAEIRYILQIVFWILLVVSFHLLSRKLDFKIAYAFLAAMLSIAPFAIPCSLNVINSFLVIFIMTILICRYYKSGFSIGNYMFITGAFTAFLDAFLTPYITFGVIAILLLYFEYLNGKLTNFCEGIVALTKCGCLWLAGYIGIWASKWMYATIITGENMFLNAWMEMVNASAGRVDYGPDTTWGYIIGSLQKNLLKIFPCNIYLIVKEHYSGAAVVISIALAACMILYWWKNKKEWREMYIGIIFLSIAVSPYIYYVIMHFHTFVHAWVEYRYQAITMMGCVLAYLTTISFEKKSSSEG